jgi:hypothetical protein
VNGSVPMLSKNLPYFFDAARVSVDAIKNMFLSTTAFIIIGSNDA